MVLKFSRKFYPAATVKDAARRFEKHAKFGVRCAAGYSYVTIERMPKGLAGTLPGEFSNYLLAASLGPAAREEKA